MDGLTRQMAECKAFVANYIAANAGVSPPYDEIMVALGLRSKSGVHRLVTSLLQRGHLARSGRAGMSATKRALHVVERSCPHCGGALDTPPIPAPTPKVRRDTGYAIRDRHLRPVTSARMETR